MPLPECRPAERGMMDVAMRAGAEPRQAEAEAEERFPSALVAWFGVAVLVLLSLVSFLDRQIVSLLVGDIKSAYGVSDSQIGLLQGAAFSLVYAVAALPFGYAADHHSRRMTLFVGVFIWSLAACFCGLSNSFDTLLAARIGVGFGEAALNPVIASLLGDMFPQHRRTFAFSVVSIGSLIGTTGALIVGGAVLHWAGDGVVLPVIGHLPAWKFAFIACGAPGLILAFAAFFMIEPPRRTKASSDAEVVAWAEAWQHLRANWRFYLCYLGGFSALGIGSYGLVTWTPAVLQRIYGWSAAQSGMVGGSLIAICGIAGTLSVGRIIDVMFQRGRRDAHAVFYASSGLLVVVCGIGCSLATSPWWFLLLILPTKLVSNFSGIAMAGLTLVAHRRFRGRVVALYSVATVASSATIGPSAVAFLTDVVFRDEAMLQWSVGINMVVFGLLGTLLLYLAQRPMRQSVVIDA
jgi:MFS family permease